MATRQNTDFLTFNAYSIKDLITRKLSEDKNVTDQIYEGSNLAILIDIFSYMAQTILYNLNNAASESMFHDTQMWENMNRLVRFLGYMPHGMKPASALMNIKINRDSQNQAINEFNIPSYCYVDTGKVDANGKKVYYSLDKSSFLKTNEDLLDKLISNSGQQPVYYEHIDRANKSVSLQFYNGIWKAYSTVFVATGSEFETFTLLGLKSDSENKAFVAHNFIDVFVEHSDGKIQKFAANDGPLFKINKLSNRIFTGKDPVYSIRLNENKEYEISFGDGINGMKLEKGDKIHILYLDSNGTDTELVPNEVYNAKLQFPANILGNFKIDDFTGDILGITNGTSNNIKNLSDFMAMLANLSVTNISTATPPKAEETVDEIRQNAPNWFRMGNRLVTKADYEFYVKSRSFNYEVIDVKCMNNWEFMSTFYKWLYELGCNKEVNNPRYFLRPEKLLRYYKYVDPADSNNIYLWTAIFEDASAPGIQVEDFDPGNVKSEMALIKDMTHEPHFIPPIRVKYMLCASDNLNNQDHYEDSVEYKIRNYDSSVEIDPDKEKETYLEITLNDNVVYSNNTVISKVKDVIDKAFHPRKNSLGNGIDNNQILNDILAIDGIERVRTIYHKSGSEQYLIRSGVSFASWSDLSQLNGTDFTGIDLEVSNGKRNLLPFQFPVLTNYENISSQIVVIRHSQSYLNEVIY